MKKTKKTFTAIVLFLFVTGLAVLAYADLESFLSNVNIEARADMNGFSIKLGAQFGVPVPKVQAILMTVDSPADAFMCLQLGQMAHKPLEVVMANYESHKGKGWGVIAKELGIKPGSPEFHTLKRGDFVLGGTTGGSSDNRQAKGAGKGKGRNK